MQLEGKRIIVTGGARGMGASAVRAFAAEGARVVSLDVNDEQGEKVAALAGQAGPGTAHYRHCDIAYRAQVDRTFDWAVSELAGLDALVNAAGLDRAVSAERISDSDWDLVNRVNVQGTVYTNQAAFRHLREHGGRIVNFASAAGMVGQVYGAHYAASKGAVLAWTRSVAREWGRHNITVNAVAPAIWTPLYEQFRAGLNPTQLAEHEAFVAQLVPLGGRFGDPDRDLAPVLVFLVSAGARFITGQTIAVDGGAYLVR